MQTNHPSDPARSAVTAYATRRAFNALDAALELIAAAHEAALYLPEPVGHQVLTHTDFAASVLRQAAYGIAQEAA